MPVSQADRDFGMQMYIDQMLPEQIAEQEEGIAEHRVYIQDCNKEIRELRERLASTSTASSNTQTQEWRDRITSLEREKREYQQAIQEMQAEKRELEQQRREAIRDQ